MKDKSDKGGEIHKKDRRSQRGMKCDRIRTSEKRDKRGRGGQRQGQGQVRNKTRDAGETRET